MKLIVGLLMGTVLVLLAAVIIEKPFTDSATDETTQTFTAGVAASATSATVVLTNQHWYSDKTDLTVTRSGTHGDVTAKCTLGTDRKTLTCSSLTSDTSATDLTVNYLAEIKDSTLAIVLKVIPFLVILGGIAGAVGAAVMAGMSGVGKGNMTVGMMEGVMVVFVGAVLTPVVLSFQSNATTTYDVTPEFIGVSSGLSLVPIAFILGLLAVAFAAVAPQFRKVSGSGGGMGF